VIACVCSIIIRRTRPRPDDYARALFRIEAYEKQTSRARKYLRVMSFLPFLRLAMRVVQEDLSKWNKISLIKVLVLFRLLGLAGYFFFENVVWAINSHLLDIANKRSYNVKGKCFLLFYICCSSCVNVYQLKRTHAVIAEGLNMLAYGSEHRHVEAVKREYLQARKKSTEVSVQLYKNILEFCLAGNFVFSWGINPAITMGLELVDAVTSVSQVFGRLHEQAKMKSRQAGAERKDMKMRHAVLAKAKSSSLLTRKNSIQSE